MSAEDAIHKLRVAIQYPPPFSQSNTPEREWLLTLSNALLQLEQRVAGLEAREEAQMEARGER